ncbi:MAG: hypothetical protein ACM3UZ_13335 [Acidobacteriota bacterium]
MNRRSKSIIGFLVIITVLSSQIGCGSKTPSKKPVPKAQPKPPSELQAISSSVKKLEDMLSRRKMAYSGIQQPVQSAAQTQQKSSAQGGSAQGTSGGPANKSGSTKGKPPSSGQGGQSSSQSGGQTGTKSGQAGQQANQQSPSPDWSQESQEVIKLHQAWNKLEPKAVTKGLSSATQTAMEMALSDLTHAVNRRNLPESELQANQVYRYYVESAAVFGGPVPPDLGRVQYHIKEARIQGNIDEWRAAHFEALTALDTWHRVSYSLDKIDRNQLHQAEHSITDVRDAVDNLSPVVTEVKAQIAINNLQQMEKKLKTPSAGGGK